VNAHKSDLKSVAISQPTTSHLICNLPHNPVTFIGGPVLQAHM